MLANRKAKDTAMASAMKAQGVTRKTSRCCICYRLIPTGSKKVGGEEVQPDVTNHVTLQCTGPARKGAKERKTVTRGWAA